MTFNHDKNSLADALGVEQHKYAGQLASVLTMVFTDDLKKASEVSEMMHRSVDYNIVLMLATNHLMNIMADGTSFGNISEN
jgi:hypothetical protein